MTSSNPCVTAIAEAVASLIGVAPADIKVDSPPRAELGDFAVGMFAAARVLRQPPPAVAARVAAELPRTGFVADASAAGPFVNVRVDRARALAWVIEAAREGRLVPAAGAGQTVCIDYSSPNISKELAYHHIRSTMLGHALAELHRALGARVVGINHLGDWGTTHGMVLAAYQRWGSDYPELDVAALAALYRRFRAAMAEEPGLDGEARAWFKRLEDGEPEARALWQRFRDISWAELEQIYQLLGVRFDDVVGESFYEDKMAEVVGLLAERDLTSESEGALVVELPGEKTPMLIQTRDGTTLYATRDLAAALYRWRTYQFTRSLYVVDRGQSLHFRQLFKALALLGFEWADRCEHVPFGLVRLGGKKTATRTGGDGGGGVLLKEVFAEAMDRVRPRIAEANPTMPAEQLEDTARRVGIGAVVFANVLPQRDKDVDFDWDKAVSLSGDSGPYLQYTSARCASIARKAGELPAGTADFARLTHDAEWAVARRLLDFGDHVVRAAAGSEPHVVAHYLLALAGDFSYWYTLGNGDPSLRVLCDDADLRASRLALVAAVRAALDLGLGLLGMAAVDVM